MKHLKALLAISLLLIFACSSELDVANTKADFNVSANQLINDFEADENIANEKYLNKIIETVGQISGIEKLANGTNQVVLETGSMGSIQCNLDDQQNKQLASLALNEPIKVKGICVGMLLDVVLEHCVIVPN